MQQLLTCTSFSAFLIHNSSSGAYLYQTSFGISIREYAYCNIKILMGTTCPIFISMPRGFQGILRNNQS
jgi:hypothetical protein